MSGEITIILGPMFSTKTSQLLNFYERSTWTCKKNLLIKNRRDTRYSTDSVSTHNGRQVKADIITDDLLDPDVQRLASAADNIFIDEIQFYLGAPDFCNFYADLGKKIYVSGLNGDRNRKPFDVISQMIPLANHIIKLNGICMRCKDADSTYTFCGADSSDQELIGGSDIYMGVCRDCYQRLDTLKIEK